MNRITAIVPLLLGSTRIPDKNLLLVNGYPLAYYVVKACQEASIFDAIYINSEDRIFERYARQLGVEFYERPAARGGSSCTMANKSMDCAGRRCQVHDHYLTDFLEAVPTQWVVQVHATSPLLASETIQAFGAHLLTGEVDSLFAVEPLHAECLVDGVPVNFDLARKTKTQDLRPVQRIAWGLAGWNAASFLESYWLNDERASGPTFVGRVGFHAISHIEALDADTTEELFMIEACLDHRKRRASVGRFRFDERIVEIDSELTRLISRDGVTTVAATDQANQSLTRLSEVKANMAGTSWCHPLIYTETDQCCLISQAPGEGCRAHYHTTKDEWWLVVDGAFEWHLGTGDVLRAEAGDVVFLERGMVHTIVCVSDTPGIRLACGGRDMAHIYVGT